jgi:two-component system OmpR family response regulator
MSAELRVLVADDDRLIVWLWARVLQWGFDAEVVAVFDGASAVARVAEERFDLVVTDLQMPGASGLDVLRAANGRDPPVPVLLATADESEPVLAEARRLGVRRLLPKPFEFDDALAAAREVLPRAVGAARRR